MSEKSMILISGSVKGKFKKFFNKIQKVNSKFGPFELLLCVGEFFGEENDELIPFQKNQASIPIPTYILGPTKEEHVEIFKDFLEKNSPNITYLGKKGIFYLNSGLKIAYLSGIEDINGNQVDDDSELSIYFNETDVKYLTYLCTQSRRSKSGYKGMDLLLTSQWPKGISDNENGSILISQLVKKIRPKYHFCGLNEKYFSLSPFRLPSDEVTPLELATRFISLASIEETKSKNIYGLNLLPVDQTRIENLLEKTTDEIDCPFKKLEFPDPENSGSQYFFDLKPTTTNNDNEESGRTSVKRHLETENMPFMKRQREMTDECWFCLSSKCVQKHLLISVGEFFYIALAKGPVKNTHVLLIPIRHVEKVSLLFKDEWEELMKFKESLRKFFEDQNEVVIFFETNYKSIHLQINAVSVDKNMEWKIKTSFDFKCEDYKMTLQTLPKLKSPSELPHTNPYFIAELPNDTVLFTTNMENFPLHFGREVLCSENLLNCGDKVNWKTCCLPKEEEENIIKEFGEKYKKYDFTLE